MIVTVKNQAKFFPYNDIKAGTPILYNDEVYIKLRDSKSLDGQGLDLGCAILLRSGSRVGFHMTTPVTPLNFTVVELEQA